jgi:hypothetical protein
MPGRWGSAQFQSIGDVIGDTADSSTDAIGGILATLGIAPYSEGDRAVRGSRLDAAAVTHENFQDAASDRLRIVLEVCYSSSASRFSLPLVLLPDSPSL